MTDDDLQEAERLLAEHIRGDRDTDTLWEVHREFHLAILRPALTPWDLRILDQLWHASDRYTRVLFESYELDDDERKRREVAHQVIIDAARSRSAVELRRAITEHLVENEVACLEWLAALGTRD